MTLKPLNEQSEDRWIHLAMQDPNLWVVDPVYRPYHSKYYYEYTYFTIDPTSVKSPKISGLYVNVLKPCQRRPSIVYTGRWDQGDRWLGCPRWSDCSIVSRQPKLFQCKDRHRDAFDFAINDPDLALHFLATRTLCEESSTKRIDRIVNDEWRMYGY